jgi:hypothetical protein
MKTKRLAKRDRIIPSENCIKLFFHCRLCIETIPIGESPAQRSNLSAGFSELGIQVWCERHNCNIVHIDFQGVQHPANMGRSVPETMQ